MSKHNFWEGLWRVKHVRDGKVIYEDIIKNALADEGEKSIADCYFRNLNAPTQFYLRLAYDTLVETDTLNTVQNEPSGSGYSAKLVERSAVGFPTLEFHEGDWRVITKEISFLASGGDIGPINTFYFATTTNNTGILIGYISLATARTILAGDTMIVQPVIKLK